MRFSVLIAALAVTMPIALCASPASAQFFQGQTWWGGRPNTPKAPWCMNLNSGAGRVEEDCSFATFVACQRALGNVNNGFCTQSSLYVAPPPRAVRKVKRRDQR